MPFLDPAISSLDTAIKFGLELGHGLHAIEIVESEIVKDGGGTATNVKYEEDLKPAAHNLIFQRPCHEDDYLSSKLVSEDDESLQTLGLTLKDAFLLKLQPDSAPTVNLDNFMSNRPVRTPARPGTPYHPLLIFIFLTNLTKATKHCGGTSQAY